MRLSPLTSRNRLLACAMACIVPLAGCVAAPPRQISPTVLALPAPGEPFAAFQQHDEMCRSFASERTGTATPGQAPANRAAAGAVVGAGVGAAAGALIGSASGHAGGGAAIGAGTGLVTGLISGAARRRGRAAALQRSYDMAYTQCMVGNGERVEQIGPARVVYAVPARTVVVPTASYPPPPPTPPYPPPPYPPSEPPP
jgi:hypothetical protein